MALLVCTNAGRFSPRLQPGHASSSCVLLSPLHRQEQPTNSRSRSRSRRSGASVIARMASGPGGAAGSITFNKDHWATALFQGPPSLSSGIMASTNPTVSVADEDLKTDDVDTPKLPPLPDKQVLAGVGTVTLDFLASVASFPDPDAKIRSLESLAQGGGNVGNALTAAARLGLRPRIFSKLANDAAGIGICKELESNGVDASHIVVAEEGVSPFTYVIVDRETKTRTCIHTPGYPPLEPEELSPSVISSFLNGADLLYLDGRMPDAALPISKEAQKRQLPIIIDAERKRERLDEILTFADYLVTSAKFPQIWTEATSLAGALVELALQLPRLKFIIVTQGSQGCVMLERRSPSEADEILDPNSTLLSLQEEAKQLQNSNPMVLSSKVAILQDYTSERSSANETVVGRLLVGTAATLSLEEVVDTTGAGDAFIGGITYGILAGFPPEKMLPLGATVAAAKCQALGARTDRYKSHALHYIMLTHFLTDLQHNICAPIMGTFLAEDCRGLATFLY